MIIKHKKAREKVIINFRKPIPKIAAALGVTTATVYNWKSGRSYPTPKNIKALEEFHKQK
jgi:DNA-binding transcriptional regulator YiaG